jgi:hypothetical protein
VVRRFRIRGCLSTSPVHGQVGNAATGRAPGGRGHKLVALAVKAFIPIRRASARFIIGDMNPRESILSTSVKLLLPRRVADGPSSVIMSSHTRGKNADADMPRATMGTASLHITGPRLPLFAPTSLSASTTAYRMSEQFWEENNSAVKYSSGKWARSYGSIYHGSSIMRTRQLGDSMSVKFQGPSYS